MVKYSSLNLIFAGSSIPALWLDAQKNLCEIDVQEEL
jgi:hypothetical protein